MPFWKKKKKEDSVAFRREMAAKLAGKHIKYVTERIHNEDIVIGREDLGVKWEITDRTQALLDAVNG